LEKIISMEKIIEGHSLSQSPDFVKSNIETLKMLFPTIVKEGKIDVEELKALLGEDVESEDEYYRFTWAGKSHARQEANKPSTGTLRPVKEESKDWDTTQNIFIEGDNLEALKLLQKSYSNKIKMIYIDPPYNTGKDFVYKDNYADNLGNYLSITGQTDEEGKKLSTNSETDGRYHSNWLNMIYPRLKLARNLLKEDGVIFISIDDNEVQNLRKVCDEIFGEENFISSISRLMKSGGAKGRFFTPNIEFILIYAKDINFTEFFRSKISKDQIDGYYNKVEIEGIRKGEFFGEERIYKASLDARPNQRYWIECPDGSFVIPPGVNFPKLHKHGEKILPKSDDGVWKWIFERYTTEFDKGNIIFKETTTSALVDHLGNKSKWNLYNKLYLNEQQEKGMVPSNFINQWENRQSSAELKELGIPFDFAKPSNLLKYLLEISRTKGNDIILDFFAGSGTLAHSIFKLNTEDNENRKFICVQIPQITDMESEASNAGYKNIAEITKERIRRAGEKIKQEKTVIGTQLTIDHSPFITDIGFRVFKLDSSNINAWDGNVQNFENTLLTAAENIKPERTEEDVLYEILLKAGLDLAQQIEDKIIGDKKVFNIGMGALFICLANNITTAVAEGIGQWKQALDPATCRVIFKDTSFTDVEKTNSIQILKRYGIIEVNTI